MTTIALSDGEGAAVGDRVGTVDSLRCFAMTAVIAQHCGLLPFGWVGVWLFFVISGYVVTRSVVGRGQATVSATTPARTLGGFYRRRAARILPVYYAYLLAGLVTITLLGIPFDFAATVSLFAFVDNLAMVVGKGELQGWPVGHLWTISVEMQFYLFYGLLLFLASRRTTLCCLVAALCLAPCLRALDAIWLERHGWAADDAAYAIYAGSFLHIDAFAAGALLAFASGRLAACARPLAIAGTTVLAAYCIVYIGVNQIVRGAAGIDALRDVVSGVLFGQHREIVLYSALTAANAGLVALAATRDPWIDRLLRVPAFPRIGAISYGGYVYHVLAILITAVVLRRLGLQLGEASSVGARLLLFATAYALTIGAAEISYRTLEAWFRRPRSSRIVAGPTAQGMRPLL